MDGDILILVGHCDDPEVGPGYIGMSYQDAMALRSMRDHRVVIEVRVETRLTPYRFDLEDVCMSGRAAGGNRCWCVPVDKVIDWPG